MNRIYLTDAFADRPFRGNPAAVCLLNPGQRPTDEWLQNVALEMNQPGDGVYRGSGRTATVFRWFTPQDEVDLCGHATLASAHVMWEQGVTTAGEIRFHTASGILTAIRGERGIELDFPELPVRPADFGIELEKALGGTNALFIGAGGDDCLVELASEEEVARLIPDFGFIASLPARGLIVTAGSAGEELDFVSRCFFPSLGIPEDPVTGSAHCALASYWSGKLGKTKLTGAQLSARGGIVGMRITGNGRVTLSGRAFTVLSGVIGHTS